MEPVLFKKLQSRNREKRVDMAIAREMLLNAFHGNYACGVLVAGDEDYLDLVGDVKRFGVRVTGSFFTASTSDQLRLAFDYFAPLSIKGASYKELVAKLGGKTDRVSA